MPRGIRLLTGCLALAIVLTTGAGPGSEATLAHSEYYAGTCRTSFVGGNLFLQSSFILERVIDPSASCITEHMLLFDRHGNLRRNTRVLSVSGSGFSMSDTGTRLSAAGELSGAAWHWNTVSYRATGEAGLSVQSDSQLDAAGLYRETQIRDGEERIVVYIDEYASLLSEQQYSWLLERLLELDPHLKRI